MVPGSPGLGSGLVLIPRPILQVLLSFSVSLKFVDEWKKKMVHGHEGTERCPIYVSPRFGSFCVKKNHVYMYFLDVLT